VSAKVKGTKERQQFLLSKIDGGT